MGNWRRVLIDGTCTDEQDIHLLNLELGKYEAAKNRNGWVDENFDFDSNGPLTYSAGLCSLGIWVAERMHVIGNLFERDYSPESVREQAETLARFAPSLKIKIHCGDDYERDNCIATITVYDGQAFLGRPEIETIPPLDSRLLHLNLMKALGKALGR